MRKYWLDKKKLISVISVFVFFSLFLLVGYSVYRDYGVGEDEMTDYKRGKINYDRLMGGSLAEYQDRCAHAGTACYYPPFFSIILYAYAPSGDSQSIYLHRHQLIFAIFAFSVFIFFLIGKKIFKDWKIGLLGSLFLIVSPRIFSSAFFNPKDIPFLSAYIVAIYTLLLFLEKKNLFTACLHGIATAILISSRTPGLIIYPVTFLFYLFDLIMAKEPLLKGKRLKDSAYLKAAGLGLVFLAVSVSLFILFFPYLYTNGIGNFLNSFNMFKQYPWNSYHLFMGQNITNKIPWFYSIVWFSISSPIFYLILFMIGLAALIYETAKSRIRAHLEAMRDFYLVAICGILPIIVVIVMKSVIYTNNRQMYFCYPPLLLISLYGVKTLLEKLKQKTIRWQIWASAVLVLGLAYPVYFMVRYHPYEHEYFNILAGTKMSDVKGLYTLDRWGISVKQGLEFIAQTDSKNQIRVWVVGQARSYYILPKAYRDRLIMTEVNPEYIIWYYAYYPANKVIPGNKVFTAKVGDTDIMAVYKIKPAAISSGN